jgi:hypothetical protein
VRAADERPLHVVPGARRETRRDGVPRGRVPARPVALLLALALVACGCGEPAAEPTAVPPRPPGTEPLLGPYPRSQFHIDRDFFQSADEPATVPAGKATFLEDRDEVLGLVVRDKARAYAVTMLSYHHVVNDVIEGIPVAVTY